MVKDKKERKPNNDTCIAYLVENKSKCFDNAHDADSKIKDIKAYNAKNTRRCYSNIDISHSLDLPLVKADLYKKLHPLCPMVEIDNFTTQFGSLEEIVPYYSEVLDISKASEYELALVTKSKDEFFKRAILLKDDAYLRNINALAKVMNLLIKETNRKMISALFRSQYIAQIKKSSLRQNFKELDIAYRRYIDSGGFGGFDDLISIVPEMVDIITNGGKSYAALRYLIDLAKKQMPNLDPYYLPKLEQLKLTYKR